MTLATSDTWPVVNADGVQTDYAVTFVLPAGAAVEVRLLDPATGVETLQTAGVDYTLVDISGTTYVRFSTAPASGLKVSIRRISPEGQTEALKDFEAFPGAKTEAQLDRHAARDEELRDILDRVVRVPANELGIVLPARAAWNGKVAVPQADGTWLLIATTDIEALASRLAALDALGARIDALDLLAAIIGGWPGDLGDAELITDKLLLMNPGNVYAGDGSLLTGLGHAQLEDTASRVQALLAGYGANEMQAAAGIEPRRILINTNGTHIINTEDYAPALHLILLPASGSATLDCAALAYNAAYEFVSGTGATTATLDFGEDLYIRAAHILPGDSTVRSIDLRANQRVTVIRLGGNQVFVDFGAPILEDGTWEPELAGATTAGTHSYGLRQAKWIRQGDLVTFNAEIRLSSTSGATGQLRITGLPFPARGSLNDQYSCPVPYWLDFTNPISGGAIGGNTSHINIWRPAGVVMDASELQNTSRIRVSGSYRI